MFLLYQEFLDSVKLGSVLVKIRLDLFPADNYDVIASPLTNLIEIFAWSANAILWLSLMAIGFLFFLQFSLLPLF